MDEVIKRLLESNENLLRINSELVEVNKGWQEEYERLDRILRDPVTALEKENA